MRFKYITQLKKLVGKDLEFQTQINELMKLEEDQLKVKKCLVLFNRPKKKTSKEQLIDALMLIENRNKVFSTNPNDLKELIDAFVENEQKYDAERDVLLQDYKDLMHKIKSTFFMTQEDRKQLRNAFIELNLRLIEMRDLCLFNCACFSLFILNFESDEVMISDIEEYLNSKGQHFIKVPSYENTVRFELEYDDFGFFFGK
jgi:hypothetical protein